VIIGGERERSYLRKCNEISQQLGLSGRISFVGEKKNSAAWIRGADFALIPSRSESGPLVLIEYLAAGLPVVASLTGSIARSAAANGVSGFVECGNKERFLEEIIKLCELSPDAKKIRGELGKKVAEKMFDIRRTMIEWFRIYQAARNGSQL
jgi:glycosyltransferase involved in cell wall biosynthesis